MSDTAHGIAALRAWACAAGADSVPRLVVVDPGGTCGLAHVAGSEWTVSSVPLAELPQALIRLSAEADALLCEDFSLLRGRYNDPKVPAAVGIGMCRLACEWTGTPLFLLQPNVKTEGRSKLDEAGERARAACRNEHQRDVVDLAGKAIHEYRKARR